MSQIVGDDSTNRDVTVSLRSDARRTSSRILEQTAAALLADPLRSMQEIAEAAGVARATLYRHFRTREELLDAIVSRAFAEAEAAVTAAVEGDGDPLARVERLAAALVDLGARYGVLVRSYRSAAKPDRATLDRAVREPLVRLLEEGQARGVVRRDLTPRWLAAAVGSLVMGAIRETVGGRMTSAEATLAVGATLRGGVVGPS